MKANISLKDSNINSVADILNKLLSDEYVLYTKTRNAHWNVEGPAFIELHKFFEEQYGQLDGAIDEVAERVRALGHYSLGRMKDFLEYTRLTEAEEGFNDAALIISTLLEDHESIIASLRKEIKLVDEKHQDAGNADFMTGVLKMHEKMAWMLRAHLS